MQKKCFQFDVMQTMDQEMKTVEKKLNDTTNSNEESEERRERKRASEKEKKNNKI